MTNKQVEEKLTDFVHREPFFPFVVEFIDGNSLVVASPPAFDETGAGFVDNDGILVDFSFNQVRAIHLATREPVP